MNNCTTAPFTERNSYLLKMTMLCALSFALLLFSGVATAEDMFGGAKADVVAATDTSSTLYFVITLLSLVVAVIAGITTKNWFGAIGGFVAAMVFIKAGMSLVGLS